jgi:hypothetical protein
MPSRSRAPTSVHVSVRSKAAISTVDKTKIARPASHTPSSRRSEGGKNSRLASHLCLNDRSRAARLERLVARQPSAVKHDGGAPHNENMRGKARSGSYLSTENCNTDPKKPISTPFIRGEMRPGQVGLAQIDGAVFGTVSTTLAGMRRRLTSR